MKKKVILCILILIIVAIVAWILVKNNLETTYTLGDYGVEITIPKSFEGQKKDNKIQLLKLYNKSSDIKIGATELRGDFWESNNMDDILSEYKKLIFNAYFDCAIEKVDTSKFTIQNVELGKIKMQLLKPQVEDIQESLGLVAVLIPKSHGFMSIEIYGDADSINNNIKQIDSIISTIKFSENKHDYSKDVKKEPSLEETIKETEKFFESYYSMVSGESLINQ